MKIHIYKRIFTLAFCFAFNFNYAQVGLLSKATKEYNSYSYLKTTDILLEVAKKGYKSTDLFEKLGNSFYYNNKMEEASKWYGELIALEETIDPEYYFRYAQALKYNENYAESDKWMKKFHELKSDDARAKAFVSREDYLSQIESIENDVEVYNLDINSPVSDFGTTQHEGAIIFASSRGNDKIHKWNNQPFLNLYTASKDSNGKYTTASLFEKEMNTKYHESSVAITPDNKFLFFTRNNYNNKKLKRDKNGVTLLKLYRVKLEDNKWSEEAESVHFNSDHYSVAHPTINSKGDKIYFASDMKGSVRGTKGLSDLYSAKIKKNGTLGEPKNLGVQINTEGQETFPFISKNGDFFFSSNGYPGLGGLDIYVIRDFENKLEKSDSLVVQNLGKPLNSPQDDFGYFENITTSEGFLTSNREGGKGDDDIYSFPVKKCTQKAEGIVKELVSKEILPGATVALFDKDGKEIEEKTADSDGKFMFEVDCDKEFLVRASKEGYIPDEKHFSTSYVKEDVDIELLLEKEKVKIKAGDDLAKILNIPIIYFDLNKYNIRYDSKLELEKVLTVLNAEPSMEIDIRSHTDCRGSYRYNETLSENRAKATREFFIERGISPSRLTSKGYGEYRLINDCACEGRKVVKRCSEPEHELNRRSEFIVTKLNGNYDIKYKNKGGN